MKVDLKTLNKYREAGWVKSQSHPSLPLTIWNYTPQTTYERKWDDVTMLCRGLVTDDQGYIVAHPFKKFFNYGELKAFDKVPSGDFTIYEKLDGSYVQVFQYRGEWIVSSKGSFISDQAVWATELWEEVDPSIKNELFSEGNHIFELIHPSNRIVVDYGKRHDLYLLGVVFRDGTEKTLDILRQIDAYHSFKMPNDLEKLLGWFDLDKIGDLISDDEEGFVLRFNSGERVKIKGEEYCRLHRIVTHTTSKDVWKLLKGGLDMSEFLDRMPDEFLNWFKQLVGEMYIQRHLIKSEVDKYLMQGCFDGLYIFNADDVILPKVSRKVLAEYFNKSEHKKLLFTLLDGKDIEPLLWDMVRPEHSKAFSI